MKYILFIMTSFLFISSCTNPFAPTLSNNQDSNNVISDQRNVNGIFNNWSYAYKFKDTLVYGNLLDRNFTFAYRNHEKGLDLTWSRDQEMISTYRIFSAANTLDLAWNDQINSIGDSLNTQISRGFTLKIVFSADEIVQIQGRATVVLIRPNINTDWRILFWRDESEF